MKSLITNLSVKTSCWLLPCCCVWFFVGVLIYAMPLIFASTTGVTIKIGLSLLSILLLLGVWFGFSVWSSVGNSLDLLVTATDKIAAGDVSADIELRQIESNDEFGRLAELNGSVLSALQMMRAEAGCIAENVNRVI